MDLVFVIDSEFMCIIIIIVSAVCVVAWCFFRDVFVD